MTFHRGYDTTRTENETLILIPGRKTPGSFNATGTKVWTQARHWQDELLTDDREGSTPHRQTFVCFQSKDNTQKKSDFHLIGDFPLPYQRAFQLTGLG